MPRGCPFSADGSQTFTVAEPVWPAGYFRVVAYVPRVPLPEVAVTKCVVEHGAVGRDQLGREGRLVVVRGAGQPHRARDGVERERRLDEDPRGLRLEVAPAHGPAAGLEADGVDRRELGERVDDLGARGVGRRLGRELDGRHPVRDREPFQSSSRRGCPSSDRFRPRRTTGLSAAPPSQTWRRPPCAAPCARPGRPSRRAGSRPGAWSCPPPLWSAASTSSARSSSLRRSRPARRRGPELSAIRLMALDSR